MIITCELPEGKERWRPDPFPGSDDAVRAGCNCPNVQPWPGALRVTTDCPIHDVKKVPH